LISSAAPDPSSRRPGPQPALQPLAPLTPIAALALCAALFACLGCGSAAPSNRLIDLINPALGPDNSSWLVGAISELATPEEVRSYLALKDDAAAQDFVRQFWERRNPTPGRPGGNPLLRAFEERAAAADHLYSESGYLGRRTARGTIFVLYGPPKKQEFDVPPRKGASAVEVWTYDKNTPSGLNGRRPEPRYQFIRRGDLTVPYIPGHEPRLPLPTEPDGDAGRH